MKSKKILKKFIYLSLFILPLLLLVLIKKTHFLKKLDLLNKKTFIVVTDAGYDDILGLIYLLKSPINIEAISVVNGITSVDKGYEIVKKVLSLNHRSEIPVIKGEINPLKGDNSPSPGYRISSEEILNNKIFKKIPFEINNTENKNLTLEKIIISKNKFNPKIAIISFGPLTNIAKLFLKNSSIKKYIKEIWIMGGNINTEGNTICYYENSFKKLKKAEFNFFIDPYAAKIVINSNLKIFLIPLDITNKFPAYSQETDKIRFKKNELFNFVLDRLAQSKENYLWDLVSAVIITDPYIASFKSLYLDIADENCGDIITKNTKKPNIYVVEEVKKEKLYRLLISRLSNN